MAKNDIPLIPKDGELRAVSLQVELDPMSKEDLPVSVIQVLPLNEVEIRDQRENFQVTPLSVLSILSHFGGQSVDLPIDYDHGMWTGENSLASGWGEKVFAVVPDEWFDRISPFIEQYGERVGLLSSEDPELWGVFAFVRWTDKAAEMIRNREYRYVSPVIFFSYTGEANYLWNAAIVNNPAIDGMDALAASVMPPYGKAIQDGTSSPSDVADSDDGTEPNSEDLSVDATDQRKEGDAEMPNLKKLAEMFGMNVDVEAEDFNAESFEVDITREVEALRAKADENEALATENQSVKAKLVETEEALVESSEALASANNKIDAFEAEKEEAEAISRTATIDAAIVAGQIAEAQRPWAEKNFEAFEELISDENVKLGPPQGRETDENREAEELSTGDSRADLRDKIKTYAEEKNIKFSEALSRLASESE